MGTRPQRMFVTVAGEVGSFRQAAFRAAMANIFNVAVSQIVIVSVRAGSVVVEFYISGIQPALSAAVFVQRASNPADPMHQSLSISRAWTSNDTTPPPTQTSSSASPRSADDDGTLWLGLSTTVRIVIIVIVVLVAVAACVAAGCLLRSSRTSNDEAEREHDSVQRAPQDTVFTPTALKPQDRCRVDEDEFVDIADEGAEDLYPVRPEPPRQPPRERTFAVPMQRNSTPRRYEPRGPGPSWMARK